MKTHTEIETKVRDLCGMVFIEYPIQEEDLEVESLSFLRNGETQQISSIPKTVRLFFQAFFVRCTDEKNSIIKGSLLDQFQTRAQHFFGDCWNNSEKDKRVLLSAFKKADLIIINWR